MSVKSEIAKAKENLIKSRKAVLARGGEIAMDAGFQDLPSAILNIPPDFALSFIEDDGLAYQKNVPENSLSYAQIKKIGGMCYKSKNLIPYPYADTNKTENGITWTVNADGSVTANGTATASSYFFFVENKTDVNLTIPFDMTLSGCPSGGSYNKYEMQVWKRIGGAIFYDYGASVKVPKGTQYDAIYAVVREGYTSNNLTFKPMLNEGSTALPYEPYFSGLRNAAVEEVRSEGADGTLDTFSIPQALQELDGYGQGNPENPLEYNYIDFISEEFISYGYVPDGVWVPYTDVKRTDISALLAENNFIKVEGGGTLTFENEHGYAVPSTIKYVLGVG